MRQIVIATPKYGQFPDAFVNALCKFLTHDIGAKFDFFYTGATYVEQARDELVMMAKKGGFKEILWFDLDMGHKDANVTLAQTKRLMSHDVPIVCAQYTTHNLKSHFIGQAMPDEKPDANGLIKMFLAPIGFSIIKTEVFDKIESLYPQRQYTQRNPTQEPKKLYQHFRNGLVGKNTSGGKLARINELLLSGNATLEVIASICGDDDYSDNVFMGEDFDFCCMARAAGFDILMDTKVIVPHGTYLGLPISNADLLAMLAEEWRCIDMREVDKISAKLKFGSQSL